MGTNVRIQGITIEAAEGFTDICEMIRGKTFRSPESWRAVFAMLQGLAPKDGGYDKIFVAVSTIGPDGDGCFKARINMNATTEDPAKGWTWAPSYCRDGL